MKTAGFDPDSHLNTRDAFGHNSRAPTSGGGRRVGGGARLLGDLDPFMLDTRYDGKADSQNFAMYA